MKENYKGCEAPQTSSLTLPYIWDAEPAVCAEAVILETSAAEERIEEVHSLLVSCEHRVLSVDVGCALLQDC